MGKPMAGHLIKAGHRLVVHNRSRGAVDELVAAGATAAASPAEVARAATVVITMLPDTPDVERVLTGPDGVLSALQKGADRHRHEQHLAGGHRAARERWSPRRAARCSTRRSAAARSAPSTRTLSIMVGGDEAAFDRVKPILEAMGNAEKIIHIGQVRRRPGLQGLQSDRDRRRARRRQRSVRAREEGRRRRRRACGRRCSAASRRAASSKCTASGC